MAPSFRKPDSTQKGHEECIFVRTGSSSEEHEPQYKDQQGTFVAEHDLPDSNTNAAHVEQYQKIHNNPGEPQGICASPTKVQPPDSGESTTTRPTCSSEETDALYQQKPCQLTYDSLKMHSTPAWKCDVQAWVNGDNCYRPPSVDDQATKQDNITGMARSSSHGSSGLVCGTLGTCSVGRYVLCMGSWFDGALTYNARFEIE
ncbi:hypothetical protein VM1G_02012 [Cytospora mali]|uniref:Uncharacterized protein n=1 Tax=Cytospora mali TaxID=578113 RepID=A0A194VQ78_CYTMA|nr:hypothetical protein VM1G_02012 [Valsa mali]